MLSDDKWDERWLEGTFVGKVEQTDELILLTPDGVKKSRSFKPVEKDNQFRPERLATLKGLPWKADAVPSDVIKVVRGDPLVAGNKIRQTKITRRILDKYGRTE